MFKRHGTEIYAAIAVMLIIPVYTEVFKREPNLFAMLGMLCLVLLFAGAAMQAQVVRLAKVSQR